MATLRLLASGLVFALTVGFMVGCGGTENPYPVYKTTGVIMHNNKPLGYATVIFYPEDETMQAAHAMTEEDGSFTLTTFDEGDGAGAGNYKVTVERMEGADEPFEPTPIDQDESEAFSEEGARIPKSVIPTDYGDPEQTSLEAQVTADGDNEFSFTIEE